jgi:hypothetical protein
LQPSLFTRLAVAEAELQAVEDILADVLDILAEVKANQDEIRQDRDARHASAERLPPDQRRPWWRRLGKDVSIFGRARRQIQANLTLIRTLRKHNISTLDRIRKDDLAFWKGMGRTAITGLFLIALFVIGLYQFLNHN